MKANKAPLNSQTCRAEDRRGQQGCPKQGTPRSCPLNWLKTQIPSQAGEDTDTKYSAEGHDPTLAIMCVEDQNLNKHTKKRKGSITKKGIPIWVIL